MRTPALTPGRDDDAPAFIALIERCWADYPNCILHVDAEAPELRALATYYAKRGGALWLADDAAGMVATVPAENGAWEICRLYVHPDHHGTGLGHMLLDTTERHAISSGAQSLFLWTDTRFHRAHRFYEKHGYTRNDQTRDLPDRAQTIEHHYQKTLSLRERAWVRAPKPPLPPPPPV